MKTLRINITKDCNINCSYCYITNRSEYMNLDVYKNLLKRYVPEGVSISGGEPFLSSELGIFIKLALDIGAKVNVVTNGTLINQHTELLKELKNYTTQYPSLSFSISVDGVLKCGEQTLQILKEFNIPVGIYLYPLFVSNKKIQNLSLLLNGTEVCQILFPVPMGRNSKTIINRQQWDLLVNKFEGLFRNTGVKLYAQQGYSDLFKENEKKRFENEKDIFIDCDGRPYECCLLAEVTALGYTFPAGSCRIREGKGCLALNVLYGKDYRLDEDLNPPCPLDLVKIL